MASSRLVSVSICDVWVSNVEGHTAITAVA